MPFVNFPIQCTCCRGIGTIKPMGAFEDNRKALSVECPNCQGKGSMENRVYVNPVDEPVSKAEEVACVNKDVCDLMIDEKELEKVSTAIKKIKSKKVDSTDAVG